MSNNYAKQSITAVCDLPLPAKVAGRRNKDFVAENGAGSVRNSRCNQAAARLEIGTFRKKPYKTAIKVEFAIPATDSLPGGPT